MTTGLVILHLGLVLTAFLVDLNGYLRGREKAKIDAVLSVLWLLLLGIAFFIFGWKAGLLALALSFVYAIVAKPFAAIMARRLLGYRTAIESAGPELRALSVEGLLQHGEGIDRQLSQIARGAGIAKVLDENRMTAEDLKEQFWFLMRLGMGDLAWEIVSTPADLRKLLKLRSQGLTPIEIASRLLETR